VAITAGDPSPKFHVHLTIVEVAIVEESDIVTVLPIQFGDETPNLATGGSEMITGLVAVSDTQPISVTTECLTL
jgi:hypothetical protein